MRYLFVFDSVRAFFFPLAAKLIGPKTGCQFFKNADFSMSTPVIDCSIFFLFRQVSLRTLSIFTKGKGPKL